MKLLTRSLLEDVAGRRGRREDPVRATATGAEGLLGLRRVGRRGGRLSVGEVARRGGLLQVLRFLNPSK